MDATYTQKLHEVYGSFSDSPEGIDGCHFARLCRDLNIELASQNGCRAVSATVYDLIFAKAKSRGHRRLDFNQFLIALDMVGQKLNLSIAEVIRGVCTIRTEDHLTIRGSESRKSFVGPEKFYYDMTTYTGTHAYRRSGRKEEDDSPKERMVDLKEIVNRDKGDKWSSVMGPKTPPSTRVKRTPLAGRGELLENSPMRGPERFYYDRNTYTGIHKHTPSKSTKSSGEFVEDVENRTPAAVRVTRPVSAKKRVAAPSLPATAPSSNIITPYTGAAASPGTGSAFIPEFECESFRYINVIPVEGYFQSFLHPSY